MLPTAPNYRLLVAPNGGIPLLFLGSYLLAVQDDFRIIQSSLRNDVTINRVIFTDVSFGFKLRTLCYNYRSHLVFTQMTVYIKAIRSNNEVFYIICTISCCYCLS